MMDARGYSRVSGAKVSDDGSLLNGAMSPGVGDDAAETDKTRAAAAVIDERLSYIQSLWASKRSCLHVPARAKLDPAEFYRLWPTTFLLEWDSGLSDWWVRFAGSAYGAVYGREITGARVSEIVPVSLAPQVLADLKRCAEMGEPVRTNGETNWPDRGNVYRYQRVLLPFGDESGHVTHLLGVAAFFNSTGATVF